MSLGQLNVDCGADGAISEFKAVRDGSSKVSLPVFRFSLPLSVPSPPLSGSCGSFALQMRYTYKCLRSTTSNVMVDCADLATPLGPSGHVQFLDRHAVQCPANKVRRANPVAEKRRKEGSLVEAYS